MNFVFDNRTFSSSNEGMRKTNKLTTIEQNVFNYVLKYVD